MNDQIPVHHIEIDLAAKTPKQDEDEEDYDPDQQQPDVATPTTHQPETTGPADDFTKMRTLLNSMANNHQTHDDERLKMIQIISRHLEPVLAGDTPSIILTRFNRRKPDSVNQVCPQGDSQIVQDQLSNQDVQKMVRILVNNEPLPSNVNFTSSFFSKTGKKQKKDLK